MSTNVPRAILTPPDEIARQATAALQGYTYQLYQTVSAWLSLGSSELLHVEFAEDLAVSDDGTLKLTQIKQAKAALTLRSKSVAALIRAVWTFQNANPSRNVLAALITTGRIGKEKGLTFPGKLSGLSYWRVAARDHADIEPMRTALLTLDLPADLKVFLRDGTADDIRRRILRPIRWLGSSPSQDEIERDLHERLVYFGNSQGVGTQDSKNTLSALIVELLACIGRPAALRFVTAADLLTVFQKNTYRLIPPSVLQGIMPAPAGADDLTEAALATRDAISIPLPPRAALRPKLIEDLSDTLIQNGSLWLHGSSGLGKTTLALLLARHQNAVWTFADLRDLEPRALRLVLARLSATFGASGARGLILDDLPADTDNATILNIKRVARAVTNADGVLVVTGAKPPPPTLAGALSLAGKAIRKVPYLTEDDVGEIVSLAGGNRHTWGPVVFLFCGGGHPQLVDARVMGLRQRDWPSQERLADLVPLKSGDLEAEREAVRTRLLHELDTQSRELLLRLSLLMNNFDRAIMFAVAGVMLAVPQPGILFDALVGPWIEQVGPQRYRLSPLLRDSGEAGMTETQRTSIRTTVVEHLMGRRPFPADQLLQVFILAIALKHIPALTWFSGVLVHTASRDRDLFKQLAEEVSIFAMADRGEGELLFPENLSVSAMLRYAQFRVAIATEDGKLAADILDRMLFEIDQLTGELKSNILALALGTALLERSVPLRPKRWIDMLKTLTALPEMRRMLRQRPSHTDPTSGLRVSASHDEMMFIIRATALSGIDQLCELVEVLDAQPAEIRDRYLTGASSVSQSVGHIVASAWLSAVHSKGFDGKTAAAKLAGLGVTASRWTNSDMVIELACAQAAMLDEYAGDKEGALKVLEAAQAKYPRDYRINRQRQRVYYRYGDHALALAEFEAFADSFRAAMPVDRAFAMREAGRSAAEMGDLDKTRLFFEQAWESARRCGEHMRPMMAGLSADCAILDFQFGKMDSALALMMRALTEAEPIDPKAGLKEHYCVLILMAAILWMRGGGADWPIERQAMVIGMCSNPDPLPEMADRPLPQRLLPWYQLGALEAEVSDSQFVLNALRQRTARADGLLHMEIMLPTSLMQAALRALSVERFLDVLAIYPRAVVEGAAIVANRRVDDVFAMPAGTLKPVTEEEWNDKAIQDAATSAVLVFAVTAVCSGRLDGFEDLRARLSQIPGLGPSVSPLFNTISAPSDKRDNLIIVVASMLGQMLRPSFVFDAGEAFMATVYFLQLLSSHVLGETAAGPIADYFSHVWRDILAKRAFSVRNPGTSGPLILAALSKGASNCAKLANLVLASEAAVRTHLSDELKATIRAIAEPKKTPLVNVQALVSPASST
jgi:hypothetical protein